MSNKLRDYYFEGKSIEEWIALATSRLELLRRVLDEIFLSQDDWGEIFDDDLISDLVEELK